MFLEIAGKRMLYESVKLDGTTLTIKISDGTIPTNELLALLEGEPEIHKLDMMGRIQAVYKGRKLMNLMMETVSGKRIVTASMQAAPKQNEVEELRSEIEALKETIAEMKAGGVMQRV